MTKPRYQTRAPAMRQLQQHYGGGVAHYLGTFPMRTTVHDEVWCKACKRHHAFAHLTVMFSGEVMAIPICKGCLLEAVPHLEPERSRT